MTVKRGRKRWLRIAVGLAAFIGIIVGLYFWDKHAAGNRVLVTISKETTYITEPLRPDGYPDYVAVLNQQFSEGVTPENNSAVLFLQVVGPKSFRMDNEYLEKYYRMLGISPLPEKGDYFIDSDDHIDAWIARQPEQPLPEEHSMGMGGGADEEQSLRDQLYEQLILIRTQPWAKEEFPAWAEWLDRNEKSLVLLVEASKRPRRYDPLICGENGMACTGYLPAVQQNRDVARALSSRAMLRINEGKTDKAWEDLLACHRLARSVWQGPFLVEASVGFAVDSMACAGDRALLEHGKLTASQVKRMRDDLESLPAMPSIAEKVDRYERLTLLDAAVACAQGERTCENL